MRTICIQISSLTPEYDFINRLLYFHRSPLISDGI